VSGRCAIRRTAAARASASQEKERGVEATMELRSRLTELRTAMVMEPQASSSLDWGSAERTSIRLIDWCVCTRRRTVV
jgi:hypothetical protein